MAFQVSKTAILGLKTAIFGTLIKHFKMIAWPDPNNSGVHNNFLDELGYVIYKT